MIWNGASSALALTDSDYYPEVGKASGIWQNAMPRGA
jgi:hypothetical protein